MEEQNRQTEPTPEPPIPQANLSQLCHTIGSRMQKRPWVLLYQEPTRKEKTELMSNMNIHESLRLIDTAAGGTVGDQLVSFHRLIKA